MPPGNGTSTCGVAVSARIHALTWAWWALAVVVSIQLAPAPLYVVVALGAVGIVVETHARPGPLAGAFPLLVGMAVVFSLVRVVLTALTTHPDGVVLIRVPEATLPPLLGGFTVGGDVVRSVVLASLAEGLVVVGVIAAFAAMNAVVAHDELLRAAPRAFHELGLVITVALAFVPSIVGALHAVREADRARTGGRPVRRGRLRRLVVPVLDTGMERAVHLAESMDARGFGHGDRAPGESRASVLAVLALLSLSSGFVALVGRSRGVAVALGLLGAVLTGAAVRSASRASRRVRYRPTRPGTVDLVLAAAVALSPLGLAALVLAGRDLGWDPVTSAIPPFDALALLPLAALAAPALLPPRTAPAVRAAPDPVERAA